MSFTAESPDHHLETRHRGAVWSWPETLGQWGPAALFALVAVLYGLGSMLALLLLDATGLDGVLFIPSGITVAFLLRLPFRRWWPVLLAAGLTELVADVIGGIPAPQALGFASANVIEPFIGAAIVTKACGPIDLARRRHVLWFTLGAVLAGPAMGALVGATTDRLLGGDDFVTTFLQWWLGDALAVVLVGGAILVWGSSPDRRSLLSPWGLVLILGSVALTWGVMALTLPVVFLIFIGVVLAGAIFGVRATAMTSLAVAATIAALFGTLTENEILFGLTPASALLLVKFQTGTFALTGLLIAAESNERSLATSHSARVALESAALKAERSREHDLAVRIQRGLLPDRLFQPSGFRIAARYEAARETFEVGGDWYDAISLGNDRFGLAVGDIVGHGVKAMTSMGRLRTAVGALALHSDEPAELLGQVDEFVGGPDGTAFATLFYAVIDRGQNLIEYSSAGHPPALLVSEDGETKWLDKGQSGPLLGGGGPRIDQATAEFGPGSTLILYSDGLIERRGESLQAGLDRLERLAASLAGSAADDMCDGLFEELAGGKALDDDAVVMVVRAERSDMPVFQSSFPARPEELRSMRSSVRAWMEAVDLPDVIQDDVMISIGEATANAVRHAYRDSLAGEFEVHAERSRDAVLVEVSDGGTWREPSSDDGFPGLGIGILQSIAEGFRVNETQSGTVVSFRIPIDADRRSGSVNQSRI